MPRKCSTCQAPISARNKSGLCAPCANRSPEVIAKRVASYRKRLAEDPEMLAKLRERALAHSANPETVARRNDAVAAFYVENPIMRKRKSDTSKQWIARRLRDDPSFADHLRASGRRLGTHALSHSPEVRAIAAPKVRANRLAWCPPEYWELNRTLKNRGMRLDMRKETIAKRIMDDARRAVADAAERMRQKHARDLASRY